MDAGIDDGPWLRVGEVARRTGLTVRTLHHYDSIGLLVPSGRSSGDYRLYGPADLRRLLQIEQLKSLGLKLDEVAAALHDPGFAADSIVDEHIALVRARIAAERELLTRLRALRDASTAGWAEVLEVIAVTERLRHPDSSVRVRAALDAPATAAVDTLVNALVIERDPAVAETLTWSLARHGTAATQPLLARLRDRAPQVRLRVAHALSKVGDPAAVDAVVATLHDPVPEVATKAAFALGQLGGTHALAALTATLGTEDALLADTVEHALAAFGTAATAPVTTQLAASSPRTRQQAAETLGLLGDSTAAAPLAEAVTDPDPDVRLSAVAALAQLPGATARDAIAGAVTSDDARVRLLAARLLSG